MFWPRTTGHGAFWGLVSGTLAAAAHYEITTVAAAGSLLPKLAVVHAYPSDMAQNFWGAIAAWTTCFVVTIAISLGTSPKPRSELAGLVYGLTNRDPAEERFWYRRPATVAVAVLALTLCLNVLFW
jgi:SSS family solute:Na+ symporter